MAKKEDTAEKNLQIWGERKILPLDKVKPNKGQIPGLPKNPRIIRDDKFKKLVKSIQDNPEMLSLRELLVYPYGEEYIIIGGNMRYHAIKENKYTEAPCKIIPKEATPEQLKAYMMKDNSSFGEWDFEALANEFDPDELDEWGIDVPILEEEEEEREEAKEDDYNEDDAEQAPSVCQLGDVWQLGAHRLMCGDSTSQEDIEKLMDGDLCDCYLTDPPYNVNYEGKTKEKLKIDNDTMSDGNFFSIPYGRIRRGQQRHETRCILLHLARRHRRLQLPSSSKEGRMAGAPGTGVGKEYDGSRAPGLPVEA